MENRIDKTVFPFFFYAWADHPVRWDPPAVSSTEVSFGINEIDGRDLLFTVNLHDANFKWVDNRDDWQFFAPGRKKTAFGLVLEVDLKPGGRILFAELFSSAVEM